VAVKLTAVQMTKLPLKHKLCKIDMNCSAKPAVTSGLVYNVQGRIFNNMLNV
jgi:hypothetical protein